MASFFVLLLMMLIFSAIAAPNKQALDHECTDNNLESGTYRCIFPDDEVSFYVDCLVDGTMYVSAAKQSMYHYQKQSGQNMKFKLILSATYNSLDDIDDDNMPTLRDSNKARAVGSDDLISKDHSLESNELSDTDKQNVNLTAQYIVYSVIASMALVFAFGICLLIYWWCCHTQQQTTQSLNDHTIKRTSTTTTVMDETTPFIDIRGSNTLKKQYSNSSSLAALTHRDTIHHQFNFNDDDPLLQTERNNVYDTINDGDDNEDGDELIAHYENKD